MTATVKPMNVYGSEVEGSLQKVLVVDSLENRGTPAGTHCNGYSKGNIYDM